jgi:hypothetical protein
LIIIYLHHICQVKLIAYELKSFSRLIKILADQGFTGVDFIENEQNKFSLVLEVVVQVLGRGPFLGNSKKMGS